MYFAGIFWFAVRNPMRKINFIIVRQTHQEWFIPILLALW